MLLIENLETVFEGHLPLQLVMLAEELSVGVLAPKFKRRDTDALKPLLERLERLGEGQKHQNALERLKEVLRVLVLAGELDAQVDEAWRLDQLHQASQSDELWRIHLDLSEPGNQPIG